MVKFSAAVITVVWAAVSIFGVGDGFVTFAEVPSPGVAEMVEANPETIPKIGFVPKDEV